MAPGRQDNDPVLMKLMGMAGDFNAARETKDPMGGCNAVDGMYIGRVSGFTFRLTQAQDPMIVIDTPILCSESGDRQYAGEPARLMHIIKQSEKQTKSDKFARLCWDIQKLGYDTSEMEVAHIRSYLESIQADAACVLIAISTSDNGMQNINLRGRIANAEVEALIGPLGDAPAAAAPPPSPPGAAVAAPEDDDEVTKWLKENCTWYDEHQLYHHEAEDKWYTTLGVEHGSEEVTEGYEEVAAPAPPAPPAAPKPAAAAPKPPGPPRGAPKPAAAAPKPPAAAAPKPPTAPPAAGARRVPPRPPK